MIGVELNIQLVWARLMVKRTGILVFALTRPCYVLIYGNSGICIADDRDMCLGMG
jgi:hypothetical protein